MNAITKITEPNVFEDWSRARKLLLPALEHAGGSHTENDIIAGLLGGTYRLWQGKRAAILTEFRVFPRFRALHWFLVGGDLDEVLSMEAPIIDWARGNGCSRVTCAGRKGWERVLKDYEFSAIVLFKDI